MSTGRMVGAIAGGLVAGLGITALLMKGERDSGDPSELATLERQAGKRIGADVPDDDSVPQPREQAVIQGGHLLLSAVAGATFAAVTDEDTGIVGPGIAFGLAFYGAMHWIAGPLLGVKDPEWHAGAKTIGLHAANHLAFGLLTAAGAKLGSQTETTA